MRRPPRSLLLLAVAIFSSGIGVNLHLGMNVNFLHEALGASSWQQGYLESIRETCGILSFFVIGALAGRSEPRVAAAMLFVTGVGLASYYGISGIPHVVFWSLFWSFGWHAWVPLSGSLLLDFAKKGREGASLGLMGGVSAAGVLFSLGCIYIFKTYFDVPIRTLFLVGGCLCALGALPLLLLPSVRVAKTRPFPLHRFTRGPFRTYWLLEFLDGTRRQTFALFAVLALVQEHGVDVGTISLLMLCNQILNLFAAPAAGRLVDRYGERPVLTAYFSGLVLCFLAYAFLDRLWGLYLVFMADSVLMTLRVAITTFANRLVKPKDRTQILAMGVTANHVGAVALPLVGGALYAGLGYQFPFVAGALIALFSLGVARALPRLGSPGRARTSSTQGVYD